MGIANRFYPMDVDLLNIDGTEWVDTYRDSQVSLEFETETSQAATDINNESSLGFDINRQKARGWSVRLGNVQDKGVNDITSRRFGWDLTALTINATSLLSIFRVARMNITKNLVENRAAKDAVSPVFGWRYGRPNRHTLSFDLECVIEDEPALFDTFLGNTLWQTNLSYAISGKLDTVHDFEITGLATLSGADVNHSGDASNQSYRLIPVGPPLVASAATVRLWLAEIMENLTNTVVVSMTHPGAVDRYLGDAWITEASLEYPDSAAMQGCTLTGKGTLAVAPRA